VRRVAWVPALLACAALATQAGAADLTAGPTDYAAVLATLAPGDTLHLEAGAYADLLAVTGLNGTETAWITITGPESGDPAVFVADPGPCYLTIDGNMVDGAFGLSAKDGTSNLVHHVLVEGCTFVNHDTGQQNVAISTKTPTWGWVIRGNVIDGAGTGLYLGNSDGTSPFVAGIIENNLVMDTIGYSMQVKWQQPRPDVPGRPTGPSRTIIRDNVFIKNDRPSDSGDRPSVLVGGFPSSDAGSEDIYEIYGNLFIHNPRESLLQASGRVTIHDNVFVDVAGTAVALMDHDLPLRMARVYNNTIYSAGRGISVSGTLDQGAWCVGNLVFSPSPISGAWTEERDDMTGDVSDAGLYVAHPSVVPGEMDFYPLDGACQGDPMDMGPFTTDTDHDVDFNGTPKGAFTFRGAYAGSGTNPGWRLDAGLKGQPSAVAPDGGPDAAEPAPDASEDAPPDGAQDGPSGPTRGCGCAVVT
jgi:hypothetical protein